uniref:Dynein heavy chain AAA 5 extension domain-containing protein n=1 Tax=Timema bartmani TaxID=61472 RepID=A0A7R9I0Z3_9NEOP|nr:unnamed protein product [Timema bartmani]
MWRYTDQQLGGARYRTEDKDSDHDKRRSIYTDEIRDLTELLTFLDCPKEWHDIYFVFACVWAFGATMFQDQEIRDLTELLTFLDCPKEWHDIYFVFACVWAFGATMFQDQSSARQNSTKTLCCILLQAVDYRVEFTKWWVNEFKSIKFPPQGTVFDYYIDTESKQFVAWTERLPRFNLDPDVPLQYLVGAGGVATRVDVDPNVLLMYLVGARGVATRVQVVPDLNLQLS